MPRPKPLTPAQTTGRLAAWVVNVLGRDKVAPRDVAKMIAEAHADYGHLQYLLQWATAQACAGDVDRLKELHKVATMPKKKLTPREQGQAWIAYYQDLI